jgi:hypothetical protein
MAKHIMETNNYQKFVLAAFNRPIGNTKKLEASMKKDGFWDDEPILVKRNGDGKLIILRGQHRYHVARKLGIPIKYVETQREVNIPGEEKTKLHWSLKDYLFSYCQRWREAYEKVREYHETTGIPFNACISLLAGDSAGSGNWSQKFKDGDYKLGNLSHSRVVAGIVAQAKESGYPFWNNMLFVQAVSKIAWAEGFASEVLKEKINTWVQFMKKHATKQDYVEMLDSIYNRGSRTKIPLTFLAEEAARQRCAAKKS